MEGKSEISKVDILEDLKVPLSEFGFDIAVKRKDPEVIDPKTGEAFSTYEDYVKTLFPEHNSVGDIPNPSLEDAFSSDPQDRTSLDLPR